MKTYKITLAFLLIFSILTIFNNCSYKQKEEPKAKNVILMIGDGMGLAQVNASMITNDKILSFEKFPFTGLVKTKSANSVITDSGAGGTAIATGKKTNNGMIGMDKDSIAVPSILEQLSDLGKKTGIVATCAITHATPASFVAKDINRNHYEEIAMDFSNTTKLNLMIGGGKKHFCKRKDSLNLFEKMAQNGWEISDSISAPKNGQSNIAIITCNGDPTTIKDGRGNYLPDAVNFALNHLNNENGFFLMVEGSQIDWACHDNNTEYLLNEMNDFNNAIEVVLNFAHNNPNTLVVVTADHETGGLTMAPDSTGSYQTMQLRYSTTHHTGIMVPIFAIGPGSEQFSGIMDNTDIIDKIISVTYK